MFGEQNYFLISLTTISDCALNRSFNYYSVPTFIIHFCIHFFLSRHTQTQLKNSCHRTVCGESFYIDVKNILFGKYQNNKNAINSQTLFDVWCAAVKFSFTLCIILSILVEYLCRSAMKNVSFDWPLPTESVIYIEFILFTPDPPPITLYNFFLRFLGSREKFLTSKLLVWSWDKLCNFHIIMNEWIWYFAFGNVQMLHNHLWEDGRLNGGEGGSQPVTTLYTKPGNLKYKFDYTEEGLEVLHFLIT